VPHVHWQNPNLPESNEALDIQAGFLAEKVKGPFVERSQWLYRSARCTRCPVLT